MREAWHVLEPSQPFIDGWHIDAICLHLEAVAEARITRLLINVPPGTMKSLIVSVFFPAWEWTKNPSLRYLTTSWKEDFVKRDSRRMRDLVMSEWYQALWPDITLVRSGEISFANNKTGNREGMVFEGLTGGRGDRVIIDDPHSTEGAESDDKRDKATRIFRESLPTRLNDPVNSAIIVVMQRLHTVDISGLIVLMKLGYVHLMLPMEFEPERRCITYVNGVEFFRDPRTYEGELLNPERFPRSVVERDKGVMTQFAVAGQFQQRPTARDGGLFKRSWFEIVDYVPANVIATGRGWDLAATKKKQSDFTAGVRISLTQDGTFYVEDLKHEKATPAEVDRLLKSTASSDGLQTSIHLPQDGGQAGVAQRDAHIKLLVGYIVSVKTITGDKFQRAKPAASQAEAGNIKLVRGDWNEKFLDEVCLFPAAPHDDILDAFAEAFNGIALPTMKNAGLFELMRQEAAQAVADAEELAAKAEKPAPAVGSLEWMQAVVGNQ